MKVFIEYQDAWGKWIQYTTLNHVPTASLQANRRATSTNRKHRLTDASGAVLDMFIPQLCKIPFVREFAVVCNKYL